MFVSEINSTFSEYLGCVQVSNNDSTVPVIYDSPNMTIQFCVEVCRGIDKPIAAVKVNICLSFSGLFTWHVSNQARDLMLLMLCN